MINTQNLQCLNDIADIRTGFTFRGKIEEVAQGNARVLQIKDARQQQEHSGDDQLNSLLLPQIIWQGKDNAFAEPETVFLPARGGYFRACYIDDYKALPLVVSSQFFVLKPKMKKVLPPFLCWLLNQAETQRQLQDASQGTSIAMLKLEAVKNLTLPIPSLDVQQKILTLNQLWQREQQLTKALLNNREMMLKGIFQQMLQE